MTEARPLRFGLMLLAAGLSRRMGGPNKLLEPYRGEPLLAHALRSAAKLKLRDCLVVTGRDGGAIADLACGVGVRSVRNERFEEGIGSSIAAGAAALNPAIEGIFVALGDMPEIEASDYERLTQAFKPGAIAVPAYKGSRGHPVLFCSSYRSELAQLSGDAGARSILKRHAQAILEIEADNPGVLRDFDLPEDFLAAGEGR